MRAERTARILARLLAITLFVVFLATAFREAWNSPTPDFPSYYTGAKALVEGDHLRDFYDWTWFKRAMSRAGIDDQLGTWVPHTPLTMLPLVPLTPFAPQTARRIWISVSLALLLATLWLLSRASGIPIEYLALLAACGFTSFYMNFILGQYYVVLLFLLTFAYYCLERDRPVTAGVLCGLAFGLKLYGGPFLLYFAVRRNWRAVAGMAVTSVGLAALVIGLFGWRDFVYYATLVLPRTLESGSVDPYHPAVANLSTMLRRAFIPEPEFNPHPAFEDPWLFFFLRTLVLLAILAYGLLALRKSGGTPERHAFAWFTTIVLMLSPSTAHYTFLILLLPVVLLLQTAPFVQRLLLVVWFTLMTLNLPFAALFPKVWLLLLLYAACGFRYWRSVRPRWMITAAACILLLAFLDAHIHMAAYEQEPGRRLQPFAVENGKLFSSFPAVTTSGVFYQAIGGRRYVLHWLHGTTVEELRFDGNALHPVAIAPGGPVQFELVAHGVSTFMQFDPRTRTTIEQRAARPIEDPATSPDGKWIAFTSTSEGPRQIRLRKTATSDVVALTGGNCNSSSPAWELDSKALIFASDCDRALGTPALYRAAIPREAVRRP